MLPSSSLKRRLSSHLTEQLNNDYYHDFPNCLDPTDSRPIAIEILGYLTSSVYTRDYVPSYSVTSHYSDHELLVLQCLFLKFDFLYWIYCNSIPSFLITSSYFMEPNFSSYLVENTSYIPPDLNIIKFYECRYCTDMEINVELTGLKKVNDQDGKYRNNRVVVRYFNTIYNRITEFIDYQVDDCDYIEKTTMLNSQLTAERLKINTFIVLCIKNRNWREGGNNVLNTNEGFFKDIFRMIMMYVKAGELRQEISKWTQINLEEKNKIIETNLFIGIQEIMYTRQFN